MVARILRFLFCRMLIYRFITFQIPSRLMTMNTIKHGNLFLHQDLTHITLALIFSIDGEKLFGKATMHRLVGMGHMVAPDWNVKTGFIPSNYGSKLPRMTIGTRWTVILHWFVKSQSYISCKNRKRSSRQLDFIKNKITDLPSPNFLYQDYGIEWLPQCD